MAATRVKLAHWLACLCVVMVALAGLPAKAEVVLGLEPQLALKYFYPKLKGHKALAVGPAGIWTVIDRQPSGEAARKRVLRACDRHVSQKGWSKFGTCEVLAVDGVRTGTLKPVWPSLDDRLPTPDLPLEKAQVFPPDGGKVEGIVVALHGAENANIVKTGPKSGFNQSWFQYLNSAGMMIVYPSVWDDSIQAYEWAGWNSPERYPRATAMNLLRVAQTRRTIGQLHQKYPGVPLYIWAHSAGGNVAQSISEGVSGAILVGSACGVGSPDLNAVPGDVPILYVFGDHDEYVLQGKSRLTAKLVKASCGKGYGTAKRQVLVGEDEGHLSSPWHQNILNALAGLFGKPPFDLESAGKVAAPSPSAQVAFEKSYAYLPLKKAFAIGMSGFGWGESQKTQRRADLLALFKCNKSETGFSYPPDGRHACRLYARGGDILKGK